MLLLHIERRVEVTTLEGIYRGVDIRSRSILRRTNVPDTQLPLAVRRKNLVLYKRFRWKLSAKGLWGMLHFPHQPIFNSPILPGVKHRRDSGSCCG